MAKILDFFKTNKPYDTIPVIEDQAKVTVINQPTYLGMNQIGGKLFEALQSHIDFNKWTFLSELFHLPITKIRCGEKDIQSDIQSPGIILTTLVNLETQELKFFNVASLLPDLFKKESL